MDIDLEELTALVELLKEAAFSEFRYEKGDLRIIVRRGDGVADDGALVIGRPSTRSIAAPEARPAVRAPAAKSTAAAATARDLPDGAQPVTSPLLGTFYTRPKPGEAPFVAVGSRVQPDSVLCIIEVMKLMNSVVAGVDGVIAAIHANEGDLVEHNQLLFSIVPATA